jgi:hypothetical protein
MVGGAEALMVATSNDGVAAVVCAKPAQDNIRAQKIARRILEISSLLLDDGRPDFVTAAAANACYDAFSCA